MKKYLSIIVIFLASISCLFACKQAEDKKAEDNNSVQAAEFEKPDDYATVLTVSINPQFRLYLDENNVVLAIEPVNDDAKSIIVEINFNKKKVDTVVKEIVECTDKNGFLKKDAKVDIKVTETTIAEDKQTELVATIEKETKENFEKVTVTVTIEIEDKKHNHEEELKEEAHIDNNNNADDITKDEQSNSNSTHTSKPEKQPNTSKEQSIEPAKKPSTPTHTHVYSDASCIKPQTCSCGQTNGNALGHNYIEGVCSRCKEKDPDFCYPALASMDGRWILKYKFAGIDGVGVQDYTFTTAGVVCGEWEHLLEEEMPEPELCTEDRCVVWEGKKYYRLGGGLMICEGTFSESDNTVKILDDENKQMTLQRTSTNTMKVISIDEGFAYSSIPVNTILTFESSN